MSTHIQIPTISIQKSLNHYSSLGFTTIEYQSKIFLTDGQILLELNSDNKARTEIIIQSTKSIKLPPYFPVKKYDNSILTCDPSGVRLRYSTLTQTPSIEGIKNTILGTNAGLSIETIDFKHSVEFYSHFGFTISQGGLDKDWIVLSNRDGFNISLMKPDTCPHQFSNPALTFFNGKKNEDIITHIRKENLNIIEEITHFNKEGKVDNLTIADPGGFYMFMFND